MSMLVHACHLKKNTSCNDLGQVQNHIFFKFHRSRSNNYKTKWQIKQQDVTRYSFPGPLCTLLSSGLHSGVHTCYPNSTWVLCHLLTSLWPYQSIDWSETCCYVLLQNFLHHASCNNTDQAGNLCNNLNELT